MLSTISPLKPLLKPSHQAAPSSGDHFSLPKKYFDLHQLMSGGDRRTRLYERAPPHVVQSKCVEEFFLVRIGRRQVCGSYIILTYHIRPFVRFYWGLKLWILSGAWWPYVTHMSMSSHSQWPLWPRSLVVTLGWPQLEEPSQSFAWPTIACPGLLIAFQLITFASQAKTPSAAAEQSAWTVSVSCISAYSLGVRPA